MLPAGAAKGVAAVLVDETRPVWCVLGAAAGCHPTLLRASRRRLPGKESVRWCGLGGLAGWVRAGIDVERVWRTARVPSACVRVAVWGLSTCSRTGVVAAA